MNLFLQLLYKRFKHDFYTFSHQFGQQKKKEPLQMQNARREQKQNNNTECTEPKQSEKNVQQQKSMNALTNTHIHKCN